MQQMKDHKIKTKRLLLCPSVDERDLNIYLTHLSADKEEFYLQCGEPYSEEMLSSIDFHSTGVIYYSIFLKNTDNMIGYVGIFPCEEAEDNGMLEYYIFPEYRRNGYGKEAVLAMTREFFEGTLTEERGNVILAQVMDINKMSQQFLESIGARRTSSGWQIMYDENGERNLIEFYYYEMGAENTLLESKI